MAEVDCWPIDHGCCPDWEGYDAGVRERAEALAVTVLRGLTGYRVGGCPVLLRPCARNCASEADRPPWSTWAGRSVPVLAPYVDGGRWYNMPCGCGTHPCSCEPVCEIRLPGPWPIKVLVDGHELPDSAWRVDAPAWLVRTDGGCWPRCQDLSLDETAPGTWAVWYLPGAPVDATASWMAGLLACEFAKACTGTGKCALPPGWTSLSRGGVTIAKAAQTATDQGWTGLREVDAWLAALRTPAQTGSRVYSPDIPRPRRTLPKIVWPDQVFGEEFG